ncbi:uncharacterized protein LOC143913559 [Arctopsyche grandis]|uniref:uncharacterized protein LOC143913559 n=1 Tax=Arctopsyche grandis TaxID=121162 RepID=UPI00406D6A31
MECRLCLCSAPAGSFVSIHDDPHPTRLAQRIWTCCQLRVRKGDHLPDMICHSCVNNLELLHSFRNACLQSDETSRVKLYGSLNVKREEVMLDDLIWKDESNANLLPNISSPPDDGEVHEGKITSNDNTTEMLHTTRDTREQPFICDICSKSYARKNNLRLHMTVHTKENPHKCDICLKSFSSKHYLHGHMNIHSEVEAHKCNICLKSFVNKYHLKIHMTRHSGEKPFKCNICLKSFVQKYALMRHLKCHSNEKPFKCDICSKSVKRKQYMVIHMKVHMKAKSPKCDFCSKSFTSKYILLKHLKSHH